MGSSRRIFGRQFWLLCLSNFLFCASFQMIIPELPDYLSKLGGHDYIGYIIALFTLSAGLARPFSGKITDTLGRIPVMAFGSLVCFVIGIAYPNVHSVAGFLFLRLIHGFSTGTKPTGTAAYVADIIPAEKRGEAQGTLGIFTAIGMSIGPVLGGLLVQFMSIDVLFYVSSIFALLSILILFNMKETLKPESKKPFSFKLFYLKWEDIFEVKVLPAFIACFLVSFSTGVILTLSPDQCDFLGFSNKGIFFAIFTISSLIVRLLFSKSSDIYGRIPVLMISFFVLSIAMFLCGMAQSLTVFILSAVLFGVAWGFNTPVLTAWTIDMSMPDNRGRAISTTYIALEFGIGFGALVAGYFYESSLASVFIPYLIASFFAALTFGYLYFLNSRIPNSTL